MWLVTTYSPNALFSLRTSSSTSSGGKTNLVPTMYSVKMALLDAAFRKGIEGREIFSWIRDLDIRFEPPKQAIVNNSFVKIQTEPKDKKAGPAFISSVGFREYVFFEGELAIAIQTRELAEQQLSLLKELLLHLHYLGKRGSFLQAVGQEVCEKLGQTFSALLGEPTAFSECVVMQYLDDMGPKATFESISSFDGTSAKMGRDRVMKTVFIPYHQKRASRDFTWYTREES